MKGGHPGRDVTQDFHLQFFRKSRQGSRMVTIFRIAVSMAVAVLLSSCGDKSISGIYVSKNSSRTELLQLTQAPDQKIIGTIQQATLSKDGRVVTTTANVTGVVDGDHLTLIVFTSIIPVGEILEVG